MWLIRLTPKLSRSDDVCLAQELVRDELPRSNSDSESHATVSNCGGFGHFRHVANSPLRKRCVQIIHVVDDFCFQWVPLRSDSGDDDEVLQQRQHQDWVAHDVTVVHVPLISAKLFRPTKPENCRFLQPGCVVRLQTLFLCRIVHANPMKGPPCLPCGNASSCLSCQPHRGPGCTPGARQRPLCSAPRSFGIGEIHSCST